MADSSVERRASFVTVSGRPIHRVYGPAATANQSYASDLADPGEFPYTRGLHPDGYRSRRWTMRQFAGYGSPEDTNARYKALLRAGGTGLSVAFDLPTLMGRDPDHGLSRGEVGRCGVSVATLADLEVLFDGLDIGRVTTSMTINSPAPMIFAMFLALAEQRGIPWTSLSGTIQNDILKEFIAQKEFIYPPRASMRLVTDVFHFASRAVPRWNSISVSGYHIREAGATASQELAMTLRDGIEYVEWGIAAGLPVDVFAPRLSFFFNAHNDFFEEIAKFRAARRVWARVMRERFGAKDERSCRLRFHAQTAGATLTAQQPYNNVVRTAVQALAAVLGGASSLHTNALDEALGLPTEAAATLALRTQQVIAEESGIVDVVDALGGSWFLEKLTQDLEDEAMAYIAKIDALGGMVAAIEAGVPQREIAESAYRHQQAVEQADTVVVGVNAFADNGRVAVPVLSIDNRVTGHQVARLDAVRRQRNQGRASAALDALRSAAAGSTNTMGPLLECARAYVSVGEMCDALRQVWGEHVEAPSI